MKLEIKHLAGYLPYGLIVRVEKEYYPFYKIELQGISSNGIYGENDISPTKFSEIKPILRPLSDLTKEIEVNGVKFVPLDELAIIEEVVCLQYSTEFFETSIKYLPNWIIEKLLEWHFDIYELIEKGLAIDINTIK